MSSFTSNSSPLTGCVTTDSMMSKAATMEIPINGDTGTTPEDDGLEQVGPAGRRGLAGGVTGEREEMGCVCCVAAARSGGSGSWGLQSSFSHGLQSL